MQADLIPQRIQQIRKIRKRRRNAMTLATIFARAVRVPAGSGGPSVANSESEAQWLLSHGYPAEAELARLETMGLAQLKTGAQAGNKPATVIYGKKIAIEAGCFQEGVDILRNAARSGKL